MKSASILITGASGGLASELSRLLCEEYNVIGVDPRPARGDALFFGEYHRSHYRSRKVDDLFRRFNFKAIFHLGRVPATSGMRHADRYSENVLGSQHLLELCNTHKSPLLVVLSTFHVYGAHPHNPLYLRESDPLRATQRIPQLSDALEFDHLATQFGLSSTCKTVILRPTNIVGPKISNTLSGLLRLKTLLTPLGFDPLIQLVHQHDLLRALVTILNEPQSGIFNIAGPDVLPLSQIIKMRGIQRIPMPDPLIRTALKSVPLSGFRIPDYMIDFFKFSTVIDPEAFSKRFNFSYSKSLMDAISDI